jgi:hypothetical protein
VLCLYELSSRPQSPSYYFNDTHTDTYYQLRETTVKHMPRGRAYPYGVYIYTCTCVVAKIWEHFPYIQGHISTWSTWKCICFLTQTLHRNMFRANLLWITHYIMLLHNQTYSETSSPRPIWHPCYAITKPYLLQHTLRLIIWTHANTVRNELTQTKKAVRFEVVEMVHQGTFLPQQSTYEHVVSCLRVRVLRVCLGCACLRVCVIYIWYASMMTLTVRVCA